MPKKKKIDLIYTENLKPVLNVLDEQDAQVLSSLKEELTDNWRKDQVYRTDTEARISILNDIKHPTAAAKYWQSVREQSAMFDNAVGDAYHLRYLEIRQLKWERKLKKAIEKGDDIKQMEIQLKLDGNLIEKNNTSRSLKWRIKELKMWSDIKNELDDGSFDTQDPNTHKVETYKYYWSNRVKAVTAKSTPGEVINAVGSYIATEKLVSEDNKLLSFKDYRHSLPPNYRPSEEDLQRLGQVIHNHRATQVTQELPPEERNNIHPMLSEAYNTPHKVLKYIEPVQQPQNIKEVKEGEVGERPKNSWY